MLLLFFCPFYSFVQYFTVNMTNYIFFVIFTKVHKKLTQKAAQYDKIKLYKIVSAAGAVYQACVMSAE